MNGCYTEGWTLEDLSAALQNRIKDNKRIVVPMFQRGLRWSQEQKQTFIDSLERGYPVGTMLFYEQFTSEGRTYILVDGLQRSNCIRSYINNPSEYLGYSGISDLCCEQIMEVLCRNISSSDCDKIKGLVLDFIKEKKTFKNLQYYTIAERIRKEYGGSHDIVDNLISIFEQFFLELQGRYNLIASTVIPVIVYTGDSKNLPEIFDRINSKGTPLDQYEVYAASWPVDKKFKIENSEIIEHVINKYESFISDGYEIDGYSKESIRNNHLVSAFEYLFGLSKYIALKYKELAFHTNKLADEVNPLAFELVNACLNDSNKIASLYENIYKLDVNVLERQLEQAIEFVLQAITPIVCFKANNRNLKNKIYHSKFQIMSMVSTTFKEMFGQKEANLDVWETKKNKLQKNLLQYYIYDILTNWWSDGGTGKIFTVAKPNRYLFEISPQSWSVALNGYFEKTIQKNDNKKIAPVSGEEYVFLNAIYMNIFTASDQLSGTRRFDVEHIVPKKQMQNLIDACKINNMGLPISCIANLCYLPESTNRSKGAYNFYQDKKYLKNEDLDEIETKYSFTTQEDLEWMDMPYECTDDFQVLKEEYIRFLRNRFDVMKQKFCASLGIEYVETSMEIPLSIEGNENRSLGKGILNMSDKTYPYIKKFEEITGVELVKIKGNTYCAKNQNKGYFIAISKAYEQENRLKYWFSYRLNPRMKDYEEVYFLYGCGDPNTIVCIPKSILERCLENLNTSVNNDTGEVSHWHIVFFKDVQGAIKMLLSKPTITEIDITKYLIK